MCTTNHFTKIITLAICLCFLGIGPCVSQEKRNINKDSTEVTTTQDDTLITAYDNQLIVDSIDREVYTGLPYWDSSMERYDKPYIDTFTEAGIKFRIVHGLTHYTSGTAFVEKFWNGKWVIRIVFERTNHTDEFSRFKDVNRDGYKDIMRELRFTKEVYFFDPLKKDFINPATAWLNNDVFLLDKAKNIFCDMQVFKGMVGQLHSQLYTFKGYKQYLLFDLYFYNHTDDGAIVSKLVLSKCVGGLSDSMEQIAEFPLKRSITWMEENNKYADGTEYFYDYRKFWKERYKKLLNYSLE